MKSSTVLRSTTMQSLGGRPSWWNTPPPQIASDTSHLPRVPKGQRVHRPSGQSNASVGYRCFKS